MTVPSRLRVGVIGLGYIGSAADEHLQDDLGLTHASAYQALPGANLVAGADPAPERRSAFIKARKAAAYEDYKEMLERE
jgi:predicted dehydrogenase